MLLHSFCNVTQDAVAVSVVESNGVERVFATCYPEVGTSVQEQTQAVIESLTAALRTFDASDSLLHLTFFLADPTQMASCRQVVRSLLGKHLPAISLVPQPPCRGALVAVEALALGKGREKVKIERVSDQLLLTRQDGRTWVYADQAIPTTSASGVYEKTICSYQHLRRLLPLGGARLDQVVRTWLYLGGIVDDDESVQRYKELNRARAEVYEGVPFLAERLPEGSPAPVFPASTGIGTNGRSMSISALALLSDEDDVVAVPLENPRQTSAFDYSTRYSPQSPKFSRGMAVIEGEVATLFISGTASITHSETRHVGDVVAQTQETLENITALISGENLTAHGLVGHGTTLQGLAIGRVYVKRLEDYPAVRRVCEERLAGVPLTYLIADVCRSNLLVEIEAIAYSRGEKITGLRRCAACGEAPTLAQCRHLCPEGCPERNVCPHAVLS